MNLDLPRTGFHGLALPDCGAGSSLLDPLLDATGINNEEARNDRHGACPVAPTFQKECVGHPASRSNVR